MIRAAAAAGTKWVRHLQVDEVHTGERDLGQLSRYRQAPANQTGPRRARSQQVSQPESNGDKDQAAEQADKEIEQPLVRMRRQGFSELRAC